jgi:hypothetical protein
MSLLKPLLLLLALTPTAALAKGRKPLPPPAPPSFPVLDRDASQAAEKGEAFANSDDCLPLHVRDQGVIGILFQQCSPQALAKDGDAVEISDNFKVPEAIARRVNFWRRVYALWGKDK